MGASYISHHKKPAPVHDHKTKRIRASSEKWAAYKTEIEKQTIRANEMISDSQKPMNLLYKKWQNVIESAARKTLGKTTFKQGKKENESNEVKQMQLQKQKVKQQIQEAEGNQEKQQLINDYKDIQQRIRNQLIKEKTEWERKYWITCVASIQ